MTIIVGKTNGLHARISEGRFNGRVITTHEDKVDDVTLQNAGHRACSMYMVSRNS